jgi:O-antigen/teichoic acid export membrane protein
VSSATNALSLHRLKRRALSLGAVNAFDHAIQFVLPVLLVRCLDPAIFGEYRLLWLAIGTVMTFATLNMCATLYYFIPRSEPCRKRLYAYQTLLFLVASGLVCAFLVSPANPVLPAAIAPLHQYGWLPPALVALWVVGILVDRLPTVDERIVWQACATVSMTSLRALLTVLAAWLTGDMKVILWMLLAVAFVKVAALLYYISRRHGFGPPWFEWAAFSEQFRHSAPLGVNSAFHGLRGQADQWVAVSLFALSSFAAFSIAALVGQLTHLLRHSVMEAFLPSMSRLQAAGEVRRMLEMNSRGNVMVGRLLYPLLALSFAFAPEFVTLVYTATYAEAVPVMRVYLVGMAANVVEIGSLVMLLRQGSYALRVTAITLVIAVAVSWTAAQHVGLAGAAIGSVVAIYIDRALVLRRISRQTGVALRRLQDWSTLAMTLAIAVASGLLAWVLVEALFAERGPLLRLIAGAGLIALVHAVLEWRNFATLKKETT